MYKSKKVYKGKLKKFFIILSIVLLMGLIVALVVLCVKGGEINPNSGVLLFLPDALGGFIGVLAGFVFEYLIFEKIRDLKKFETLFDLLLLELKDVGKVCKTNIEVLKSFLRELNETGNKEEFNRQETVSLIPQPILEDIMDSAENLVLFNKKYNPELLNNIRVINNEIILVNVDIQELAVLTDEDKKMTIERLIKKLEIINCTIGELKKYYCPVRSNPKK